MPRILVFDNYDSFTYNLVHLVEKLLHQKVEVFRNDQIPLEKVKDFDKIILSPGPGVPVEAGLLLPLIKEYASSKSILGVCLGHQAIGEAFGGKLVNLSTVYHGVATPVKILQRGVEGQGAAGGSGVNGKAALPGKDLFAGLPDTFDVGRYHSWVISEEGFPQDLEVTARDENNYIMALRHKNLDVQGVQFHPESVLTPLGETILKNWLSE
ncbi:MAG TPA: aminodeoxychorismate/anthranilate synthase component II [Puia sp.]|nr:aminodeoxychorismate/anthranilate synthase component II [Puia sp.]